MKARTLLVILRSSIAFSMGAAEICSYGRSGGPPSSATSSGSDTPRSYSKARSLRFSSRTRRAAVWISDEASMPTCSQLRNLASSSWRYSLRLARERPDERQYQLNPGFMWHRTRLLRVEGQTTHSPLMNRHNRLHDTWKRPRVGTK